MKLLVVTPTLGQSPWLEQTAASVPAGCEYVLVGPADVLGNLRSRYPAATLVQEPGGGMYAAINAALKGRRDWDAFTYINDDDLLLPGFAAVMQDAGTGDRGIVYGGVRLIDGEGRRLGSIPISACPGLHRELYAQRIEPVYQHGTVISRAVFEALDGFDASFRFCGDSELLARACLSGVAFHCATRREVAAFRLRPGQLTKHRPAMLAERARVDEKLGLLTLRPDGRPWAARWRFRVANLGIYAERIVRHGFLSFDELLVRAGQS
jgi:hypothetical protein